MGRVKPVNEQVLEAVIIGDTLDGDELIVHPKNPERIYLLPRQSEEIYVAGDGLPAAIEWLCTSGTLTEPFRERNFEPFNSEARQHGDTADMTPGAWGQGSVAPRELAPR